MVRKIKWEKIKNLSKWKNNFKRLWIFPRKKMRNLDDLSKEKSRQNSFVQKELISQENSDFYSKEVILNDKFSRNSFFEDIPVVQTTPGLKYGRSNSSIKANEFLPLDLCRQSRFQIIWKYLAIDQVKLAIFYTWRCLSLSLFCKLSLCTSL